MGRRAARRPGARAATVLGSDVLVHDETERRRLHETSGADVVDMESGCSLAAAGSPASFASISDDVTSTIEGVDTMVHPDGGRSSPGPAPASSARSAWGRRALMYARPIPSATRIGSASTSPCASPNSTPVLTMARTLPYGTSSEKPSPRKVASSTNGPKKTIATKLAANAPAWEASQCVGVRPCSRSGWSSGSSAYSSTITPTITSAEIPSALPQDRGCRSASRFRVSPRLITSTIPRKTA